MKAFNLEAALNGEPVMLRNGKKAIIYYCTPAEFKFDENIPDSFPLKGMVFDFNGYLYDPLVAWRCNGSFGYSEDNRDIVGMWEEPKISIEDLPKPFCPEESNGYFYISDGKVAYNLYHSKYSESSVQIASNGQSFRTRKDAQKWLDFMKSMME